MARAQTSRSRTPEADEEAVDPALPQKRRARHRLIGAAALSLVAAVVVPLVFEPEPTRSPHDVNIAIPSRDTPLPGKGAAPLVEAPRANAVDANRRPERAPEVPGSAGRAAGSVETPASAVAVPRPTEPTVVARAEPPTDGKADSRADPPTESKAEPKASARAEPKADTRTATKAESKTDSKADSKGESKADPKGDARSDPKAAAKAKETRATEGRKSQPDEIEKLVESSRNRKPQTAGKYVLQVGAFSSEAGAAGAVEKARAAGVKVYTEKVSTERGERIRVRVGPFATREAADEARASLKAAGVAAATIAP